MYPEPNFHRGPIFGENVRENVTIHHDGPGPPLAKQKKKKMDFEE